MMEVQIFGLKYVRILFKNNLNEVKVWFISVVKNQVVEDISAQNVVKT